MNKSTPVPLTAVAALIVGIDTATGWADDETEIPFRPKAVIQVSIPEIM